MKGTRFIKRYSEKNLIWANGPFYGGGGGLEMEHFGPEMGHLTTLDRL